jgi:hypothetical protein
MPLLLLAARPRAATRSGHGKLQEGGTPSGPQTEQVLI